MKSHKGSEVKFDPGVAMTADLLHWVKAPERLETERKKSLGKYPEVDRAIAKRDDATGKLLSALSHSSDRVMRRAVIMNPGVEAKDLIRLGPQFSKEFLENPALTTLLIEHAGAFADFEEKLLIQIVKREECPESFLKWALSRDSERLSLAVAMNPNLSASIQDLLKESPFAKVRKTMSASGAVPIGLDAKGKGNPG